MATCGCDCGHKDRGMLDRIGSEFLMVVVALKAAGEVRTEAARMFVSSAPGCALICPLPLRTLSYGYGLCPSTVSSQ